MRAAFLSAAFVTAVGCSLSTSLDGLSDKYAETGPVNPTEALIDHDGGDADGRPSADDGEVNPTTDELAPETIARVEAGVTGLAVGDTFIAWMNAKARAVSRVDKVGGAASTPIDINLVNEADQPVSSPVNALRDLAFDPTTKSLWFGIGPKLYSATLAGRRSYACVIVRNEVQSIAADATGVVVSAYSETDGLSIHRRPFEPSDGPCEPVAQLGVGPVGGLALAEGNVYWALSGAIYRMAAWSPTVSSAEQLYAVPAGETIEGIAADKTHVYVMTNSRSIVALELESRRLSVLYSAAPFGGGDVAVDDKYVLWSEAETGAIKRRRLPW